jgi:hypothetical protein
MQSYISFGGYKATVVYRKFNIVGIEQLAMDNGQLKVYPNPTREQLTIDNGELTIENVEIYDVMGRSVGANLRVRPNTDSTMTINVESLPVGVYFLRAYGKDAINRVSTARFVKQ